MDDQSARDLHHSALVIDSHNDSVVAHIRRGNRGLAGESGAERDRRGGAVAYLRQNVGPGAPGIQLDIGHMRSGGLDVAFFSVDNTRAWGNHLLYAMDALGYLTREIDEHADDIVIARSAGDITKAREEGKLAAILAVENSNALQQSPYVLGLLWQIGVRSMTITHSARTWAGDGCEVRGGGGLTAFGREVVDQMNELGMLIDVSHLNEIGFWDVLECSRDPVIASHSCCYELCPHPRNLRDDQLRALAEHGGVAAMTFVPSFIDAHEPTLAGLLDHIDHAVEVAGVEAVGLGSDFDGGGDLLNDASSYAEITMGLASRQRSPSQIQDILGRNQYRLLESVIG